MNTLSPEAKAVLSTHDLGVIARCREFGGDAKECAQIAERLAQELADKEVRQNNALVQPHQN